MSPRPPQLRQLLMARFDWMEARVMENAVREGYGGVTTAMNRMFAHLHGKPMGLSELARVLSVSRQAVHQLANDAAAMGLVEFVPSERDGRVKLLRFTQKGWVMVDQALRAFERIEQELAETLGPEDVAALRRILGKPWSADERA